MGKYVITWYMMYMRGPRISPRYKVQWLREASQIGQTFLVKKSFETQHGRIAIDPAILAAILHRFIAIKKKIQNADVRVWGDARGDQKPETFFGGAYGYQTQTPEQRCQPPISKFLMCM